MIEWLILLIVAADFTINVVSLIQVRHAKYGPHGRVR